VGQPRLMRVYKDAFRQLDTPVAQLLLTYDDLDSRLRYRNAANTLNTLLAMGVVPIINENDTVAVEEIKFGDNDYLSALVFELSNAGLLILLTDVDGVLENAGARGGGERVISTVSREDWAKVQLGVKDGTGEHGTGGMKSKIQAARAAVERGGCAVIARGKEKRILERIVAGEAVGTYFAAWGGRAG